MNARAASLQVVLTDEQLDDLAGRIARKLLESSPETTFDQDNLPPGMSRRSFLEAARKGEFVTRKLGRRIVAKREDVEAWIASRPSAARPSKPGPVTAVDPGLAAIIANNGAKLS